MIDEYEQQQRRLARRREALRQLTADVRHLVAQPPASVAWPRTKTDLVEMVNLAWQTHEITDGYGRPCTRGAGTAGLQRRGPGGATIACPLGVEDQQPRHRPPIGAPHLPQRLSLRSNLKI